jgi:hypothetical protein
VAGRAEARATIAPVPRVPLRGVVAWQALLLGGVLLLQPAVRRSLPPLASSLALVVHGDVSGASERLTPHAGEAALTPLPQELVAIARAQRIGDFALSPALSGQADILQRVTEGAWPIQLSARSRHLFAAKGEALPPPCRLRHGGRLVDYARCG